MDGGYRSDHQSDHDHDTDTDTGTASQSPPLTMPSSSSSASSSAPTSLALRSSCDRCRAHKLKCSGAAGWKPNYNNSNSETPVRPCDRCLRAKADCVFGRRAQTGRPPSCATADHVDSKASISSTTPSLSSRSTASYPDGASTPSSLSHSADPAFTYDPHYFELDGDFPMDLSSFDDFAVDPNWSWNNLDGGASSVSLSHCDIDPFAQPTPTYPTPSPGLGLSLECPPKPDSPQSHVLRLSTLLADTIRTSDELSHGVWKAVDGIDALAQYPIGGVLHLAHQFRAIHADIAHGCDSRRASGDGSASPTLSALTVSVSSLFSNPAVDMSSRCIVISCHISLVKLYGIVFRDLQNILETLPSSPAHTHFFSPDHLATPTTLDPLSHLRLFELPSTSEARSKIFTAVSMLLRAFPPSEMTLGALQDVAAAGQHRAPVANMGGQDAVLCNSAMAVRNESDRAIARLQSLEQLLLRKAEH